MPAHPSPLRRLRAGGRRSAGAARGCRPSGRSGLRPSLVRGDSPRNAPLKTLPRTARCSHYPIIAARRLLSTTKVFFVTLRGPSRPFVDQKRCSRGPLPFVDRPIHDPPQVFFVVLRGPSWIKKVFPPPFIGRPNHDPAKVFFVTLRGPSRPFVDQKRCSPLPFVDRPIHDPPRGSKKVLPYPSWTDQFFVFFGPSRPFVDQKRCSPLPFVDRPIHDPPQVFFVVLRGPSWIKKVFSPALRKQTEILSGVLP